MNCCDHHHKIDCRQGHDCPARLARLARLAQPTAAPLNPGHSDAGNQQHKFIDDSIDEFLDDTSVLLLQGIALLGFVVSALMYASIWL